MRLIPSLLNNLSRGYQSFHLLKLDQSTAKTQRIMDDIYLPKVELVTNSSPHTTSGKVYHFWGIFSLF